MGQQMVPVRKETTVKQKKEFMISLVLDVTYKELGERCSGAT